MNQNYVRTTGAGRQTPNPIRIVRLGPLIDRISRIIGQNLTW